MQRVERYRLSSVMKSHLFEASLIFFFIIAPFSHWDLYTFLLGTYKIICLPSAILKAC